ncbi:YdcF family protein [Silvimonas amylolytica]|uniref:Membrane protein n=1 Tax=Silvimonas amylolytica TaxID=449663 RepID=A0ABQ2PI32_9NEIS|nr:YdcF family protein [Silvimonas amylolytica]GGP24963.1 membrane protein [Silvimonas amylolytica]
MIAASFLIKNAIGALLLPPGIHVVLGVVTLALWQRRAKLARGVLVVNLAALYALSTPALSHALMASLEPPPITPAALAQTDAIVCLGGGTLFGAQQTPDERDVNATSAERVRYTARLARATGKPVALSGGTAFGEAVSEGELMARVLRQDYGITPVWTETRAVDTADNATFLARQMLPRYRRIALVSSAWHLARAQIVFKRAGFEVTLAPTSYQNQRPFSLLELLPSPDGLSTSYWALHEYLGMLWYHR